MAAQIDQFMAQAPTVSSLSAESSDLTHIPRATSIRSASTPRGQFDRYMSDVKKTALLSPDKLLSVSREAYVHRFGMLKIMSQFPPCSRALAEQFEYHTSRNLKLYNFVTGYCDQSVRARDDLLVLNRQLGKGKASDSLDVKDNPTNEARLHRTLQNLTQYCRIFETAEDHVRQSPTSTLRRRISDTYMFIALRHEEHERQCKLFEDITHEFQRFADVLFSLVDPDDHAALIDTFSSSDIDLVTALVPTENQAQFHADAVRLKLLMRSVGLTIREVVLLRSRYLFHKGEHQRLINDIIQANLLLSARETIRHHPNDDRLFDTCQEANQGLIVAAYRYEYWLGYAFSTYACWWIKQRLNRERVSSVNGVFTIPVSIATRANQIYKAQADNGTLDGENPLTTAKLASELNCSVAQVDEAIQAYHPVVNSEEVFSVLEDDVSDAAEIASLDDLRSVVREALETLPDPKRDVCKMRWGIGYPEKMTLDQVSHEYGITKERVRKIEQEALRILRRGCYAQRLQDLHAC